MEFTSGCSVVGTASSTSRQISPVRQGIRHTWRGRDQRERNGAERLLLVLPGKELAAGRPAGLFTIASASASTRATIARTPIPGGGRSAG